MSRGLRRFYTEAVFSEEGSPVRLSPHETFHLCRVLRLKAGDTCQIFNQKGWGAEAVIETISETKGASLRLKKIFPLRQNSLWIKAAQALPQKKKMDDLVRQAEELGVRELWVLETLRNGVKVSREARDRMRGRWERIVIEAAKQSGSPNLMKVEGPVPFDRVVREEVKPSDRSFLFHPDPGGLRFGDVVEDLKRLQSAKEIPSVFLFLGPEGGFAEEEVRLAESRGVRKVFLGNSILRLDTAFLGVLSALRFLMSESG